LAVEEGIGDDVEPEAPLSHATFNQTRYGWSATLYYQKVGVELLRPFASQPFVRRASRLGVEPSTTNIDAGTGVPKGAADPRSCLWLAIERQPWPNWHRRGLRSFAMLMVKSHARKRTSGWVMFNHFILLDFLQISRRAL
jgi:hypothetical protein